MQIKKLPYDDAVISYAVHGNGRPVMLVHGFGEDGTVWETQINFLKPHYRLIVPDLPGTGQSPQMISDMSIEGMAEVLHAIALQEMDPHEKFALIGHSMGGYITLAYAEKYENTLRSFGLFHSTAFADSEEKINTRRKGIAFIEKNGAAAFLKTSIPNLYSPITREKNPALVEKQIGTTGNFLAAALVTYYEAMIRRPDRTAVLKNATVPVLFVMGEFDNAAPVTDVLKQSHLPERSYINILKKSGHMGMCEEPTLSNQILENFLQYD